jgi:hypothetical protein
LKEATCEIPNDRRRDLLCARRAVLWFDLRVGDRAMLRLSARDKKLLSDMRIGWDGEVGKDAQIRALTVERDMTERHIQIVERACVFHENNAQWWKNLAFALMCGMAGCLIGRLCLLIGGAR